MGERMYCPGCNSSLSAILFAVREGRPCPNCGLSAEAIMEVNSLKDSRADEQLQAKISLMIIEEDKLRRELAWCREQLTKIRDSVNREYDPKADIW